MSNSKKGGATPADAKKARLAAQLRANLQKRKAQSQSRRAGAADDRQDGLGQSDSGKDRT
jgi:hypothetical protein